MNAKIRPPLQAVAVLYKPMERALFLFISPLTHTSGNFFWITSRAGFLHAYFLIVELKHKWLVDTATYKCPTLFNCITCTSSWFSMLQSWQNSPLLPSLMLSEKKTIGLPIHDRACRLPPEKLSIAKARFNRMKSKGIVCGSSSPWASPLHMMPKASEGWRSCGDYHHVTNTQYHTYRFSPPTSQTCKFSLVPSDSCSYGGYSKNSNHHTFTSSSKMPPRLSSG